VHCEILPQSFRKSYVIKIHEIKVLDLFVVYVLKERFTCSFSIGYFVVADVYNINMQPLLKVPLFSFVQ
jgi:hypothetical protein